MILVAKRGCNFNHSIEYFYPLVQNKDIKSIVVCVFQEEESNVSNRKSLCSVEKNINQKWTDESDHSLKK